jgi:hypothetical protein
MRPSALDYSRPIYDPNYADNITGYEQSSQFYQPIYQPQYQNYSMGNPMSISQYGQQPFFGGGFGGGFMPQQQFMSQMQTPFRQPMQQFQPQMGMQTPFSSGMSQPPRTSSGPMSPIVGRSSQMRGTPNVMRRAEGGITSLLDEA